MSFGLKGSLSERGNIAHVSGLYFFMSGPQNDGLPSVTIGDTIGCGYNWVRSEIYFTLNGRLLR